MMAMQCESLSLHEEKECIEYDEEDDCEDLEEMKEETSPPQKNFEIKEKKMMVEEVEEVVVKTSSVQEV